MLHVWFGRLRGGLAIGTIFLMVIISAMNGLSVAGMAIGATIALPEMLRRGYDKVLITGVVQGGSSLGILIPPIGRAGALRHDRPPAGWPALARRRRSRACSWRCSSSLYIDDPLPAESRRLRPPVAEEELEHAACARSLSLLRAGIIPFADLLLHDRAVRLRLHQPGRKLGRRRHRGDPCCRWSRAG